MLAHLCPQMLSYVIVCGFSPGVYHTPEDVLEQIQGIDNTLALSFCTAKDAHAFWRDAIKTKGGSFVWALDRPSRTPTIFMSRKISLIDLADSKLEIRGEGLQLPYHHVMRDYPKEWYKTNDRLGRIWVVAAGRTPGLYANW